MLPLLSSPLRTFFSLSALSAVSHRPDRSGGFLGRWDLTSPTSFSPCGLACPSPDSLCVFRRELEGLCEATPSMHRLFRKARTVYGPPPPAPGATSDSAPQHGLCFFQDGPLWEAPALEESPKCNEQRTRHRDNADAPQALATATKALSKPATQSTLRLVTQPPARRLAASSVMGDPARWRAPHPALIVHTTQPFPPPWYRDPAGRGLVALRPVEAPQRPARVPRAAHGSKGYGSRRTKRHRA
jgi:hypothetical protein